MLKGRQQTGSPERFKVKTEMETKFMKTLKTMEGLSHVKHLTGLKRPNNVEDDNYDDDKRVFRARCFIIFAHTRRT
jgi:hypothetical protein